MGENINSKSAKCKLNEIANISNKVKKWDLKMYNNNEKY